uniref:Uncharacterized protein n=1 Tax=Rousettus aegyptiacus TaxID=9407 RepID=A0A7J8JFJ8_ROUAE|nr:hypothetical protein HJG63_010072 [Rousettus aegyptiacus]
MRTTASVSLLSRFTVRGGALRSPHRRHRGSHTHQTLRGGGDSGSARSVDNTPLTSSWAPTVSPEQQWRRVVTCTVSHKRFLRRSPGSHRDRAWAASPRLSREETETRDCSLICRVDEGQVVGDEICREKPGHGVHPTPNYTGLGLPGALADVGFGPSVVVAPRERTMKRPHTEPWTVQRGLPPGPEITAEHPLSEKTRERPGH